MPFARTFLSLDWAKCFCVVRSPRICNSYIYAVFKHHTYPLVDIATCTVSVTLILEVLLLLGNPMKKITNVQFKKETCHAKELTITRKSLGLIWTGVTVNNLIQLLLSRWVNLEFRTRQWTISLHDPPHRKYLPVPTPAFVFTLRLLVGKTLEFSRCLLPS